MLQVGLPKVPPPPNAVIIDPIAGDRIANVRYCSSDGYISEYKSTKIGQFFIIETKDEPILTLIIRNLY